MFLPDVIGERDLTLHPYKRRGMQSWLFDITMNCSSVGVPLALLSLAQKRCHRYTGWKLPSFRCEEGICNFVASFSFEF